MDTLIMPADIETDILTLSDRETQVLKKLAAGFSNKEIASQLGIVPKTVERYVENLRYKVRARNRTHLIAKAMVLDRTGSILH